MYGFTYLHLLIELSVWYIVSQQHPKARPSRKRGLAYFDLMNELFAGSSVRGLLHHASTDNPLNTDEEHELDNELNVLGLYDTTDFCNSLVKKVGRIGFYAFTSWIRNIRFHLHWFLCSNRLAPCLASETVLPYLLCNLLANILRGSLRSKGESLRSRSSPTLLAASMISWTSGWPSKRTKLLKPPAPDLTTTSYRIRTQCVWWRWKSYKIQMVTKHISWKRMWNSRTNMCRRLLCSWTSISARHGWLPFLRIINSHSLISLYFRLWPSSNHGACSLVVSTLS